MFDTRSATPQKRASDTRLQRPIRKVTIATLEQKSLFENDRQAYEIVRAEDSLIRSFIEEASKQDASYSLKLYLKADVYSNTGRESAHKFTESTDRPPRLKDPETTECTGALTHHLYLDFAVARNLGETIFFYCRELYIAKAHYEKFNKRKQDRGCIKLEKEDIRQAIKDALKTAESIADKVEAHARSLYFYQQPAVKKIAVEIRNLVAEQRKSLDGQN